ncbi:unnamed protein product [Lota lota]
MTRSACLWLERQVRRLRYSTRHGALKPHREACHQASPGPRGGHYDRDERLASRSETDGGVTEEEEEEEEEELDRTQ